MSQQQHFDDEDDAEDEWVVPAIFGFVFGVLSGTMGGGWVNTFWLVLIVVCLSWWLSAAPREPTQVEPAPAGGD